MIKLTFFHSRDIFNKDKFHNWITELFGENVSFDGCEFGNYYPTIRISHIDFEKQKTKIPATNLIKIKGKFGVLEQLSLGVRDFSNDSRIVLQK